MLAKMTLINAKVKGSYEYVAILILKKDEPQINPNKVRRIMSIDFASLISSSDCIYVQNAYQIYNFNYTFKKLQYICSRSY